MHDNASLTAPLSVGLDPRHPSFNVHTSGKQMELLQALSLPGIAHRTFGSVTCQQGRQAANTWSQDVEKIFTMSGCVCARKCKIVLTLCAPNGALPEP